MGSLAQAQATLARPGSALYTTRASLGAPATHAKTQTCAAPPTLAPGVVPSVAAASAGAITAGVCRKGECEFGSRLQRPYEFAGISACVRSVPRTALRSRIATEVLAFCAVRRNSKAPALSEAAA